MLERLCKRAFPKALWVYHANTGACNGCDIEVINVLTPYYDAERFGIRLVGSPRHADAILVSGPVTRQVAPALRRLLDAVPAPKVVIAVGGGACGGGAGSGPDGAAAIAAGPQAGGADAICDPSGSRCAIKRRRRATDSRLGRQPTAGRCACRPAACRHCAGAAA